MKKTLIVLALCALFCGCKKDWGDPTTRNYPISSGFTGIEVSNAFQVTVSDQVSDVVVTVGEQAHNKVVVEVKNYKLHIGFKPNVKYNGVATAIIPATILYELSLSGASSFTGNLEGYIVDIDLSGASIYKGSVSADKVYFDFSGASTYTGTVDAYKVFVDLSGASNITAEGTCHTFMEIGLSGASQLKAANLETKAVHGDMSGGSYAEVTCCHSLNVELSGGSTLIYEPTSEDCHPVINCPSSGGSSVIPRN